MPLREDEIVRRMTIASGASAGSVFQLSVTHLGGKFYRLTPVAPYEYIIDTDECPFELKVPAKLIAIICNQILTTTLAGDSSACLIEFLQYDAYGNERYFLYNDESGVMNWVEAFGENYVLKKGLTEIRFNGVANSALCVDIIIEVLE